MEEQNTPTQSASYNQAQFQMIRIHELLLRVDRLNINPLAFNPEFNNRNFKVIFNDLKSVLMTISAKLKEEDKNNILEKKDEIDTLLKEKPIYINLGNQRNHKVTKFDVESWNELDGLLFNFRVEIESLMDKYGYGNPSKDDPRRSASRR